MKHNYFTKFENKYVFNFSLIFWHTLVIIASLGIVGSLLGLVWSGVPVGKKAVEKPLYPEKEVYPLAINVSLAELGLEKLVDIKDESLPDIAPPPPSPPKDQEEKEPENMVGLEEYQEAYDRLQILIPPARYSWSGKGHWTYPHGERFWVAYKEERYRKWVITETGIESRLNSAYRTTKADTYKDKATLLNSYGDAVLLLHEESRADVLGRILLNVPNSLAANTTMCEALAGVIKYVASQKEVGFVFTLVTFIKNNPMDGIPFTNYAGSIIAQFSPDQQSEVINRLVSGYYNSFSQNLNYLKEATNAFLPLLPQIRAENQPQGLAQFYRIYIQKNTNRSEEIARIDNRHEQRIKQVDAEHARALSSEEARYYTAKSSKETLRSYSLRSIGIGILSIVIIASFLVFFSIQRSLRRIEEHFGKREAG